MQKFVSHSLFTLSLASLLMLGNGPKVLSQVPEANYDESKVKVENLPDLLRGSGGNSIDSPQQWPAHRDYLVRQLGEFVYGLAPQTPAELTSQLVQQGQLKDSKVRFREVDLTVSRDGRSHTMSLVLFMPPEGQAIRGCFLMPNFQGNHSLTTDTQIRVTKSWVRNNKESGVTDNQATEASRGVAARRAPVDLITSRGYVLASIYYGDIDPDFDDNFENGVHALYPEHRCSADHPNRWGTIAGWAWGLSRCMDYLQQQSELPADKVAVIGHSRLGKTALWAGATDTRFSVVISNNSGCGGAALSRREFGETVWRINTAFPHWFNDNFPKYNQDPSQLPVDQHMLIAAIAPRPVYVASATNDRWADPTGEYLSAYLASNAYELLGKKGLPSAALPEPGVSVGDCVGYHLRDGDHDLLAEDWSHYMDFTDRHWK